MPKIRRLFIAMILLSAALTGMVMGARWTSGGSEQGTVIESEKPTAQYAAVQAGAKEKPAQDSTDRHDWTLYTGVLVLTGLYATARITGVKKRGKNNHLG